MHRDVWQEFVVQELREDYRQLRDCLCEAAGALQQRNPARARLAVADAVAAAGPYLRFQAEFLCPAVRRWLDGAAAGVAGGHREAARSLDNLAALARRTEIRDEDMRAGLQDAMTVLAHVVGTGWLAEYLADLPLEDLDRLERGMAACRGEGGT